MTRLDVLLENLGLLILVCAPLAILVVFCWGR